MTRRLLVARWVPHGNRMWHTRDGIISERAADFSDLTEPSEAERRRADGAGHARRAEPVQ